jgi:hypothetical protein
MEITKNQLAHAYEFLCSCPPFETWNLPSAEDVQFKVTHNKGYIGEYTIDKKGRHQISASTKHITSVHALIELMAHEMIHLHEKEAGMETRAEHSPAFKLLAAQVCAICRFNCDGF